MVCVQGTNTLCVNGRNRELKVLSLCSAKGGASKSTLSLHLAVAAELAGIRTAVIDTDPQGTLSAWWQARDATTPVMAPGIVTALPRTLRILEEDGYGMVVIDTPPQTTLSISSVIKVSDLVLIPVRPSLADLWAVGGTIDIARKHGVPFAFVLSQATRGATITTQSMAALSEHGPVLGVMHTRVGYAAVLGDGQSIGEQEPRSAAASEIDSIWKSVHRVLNANEDAQKERMKKAITAHVN